MTADALEHYINNDKPWHTSLLYHINAIRRLIDQTAIAVATANAEWHDDPEADDHAEFHAPASEQFTRETRDEAIKSLVSYYLAEMTIQERANV